MTRSKEEMRLYQRERRARLAAEVTPEGVAEAVTGRASGNAVQVGVQAELDRMPDQGDGRPGLVAAALRMAELLDDGSARPQHPSAAARLRELLAELRSAQPPADEDWAAAMRARRGGAARVAYTGRSPID